MDGRTVGTDWYRTIRGIDFCSEILFGPVRGPEWGTKIRSDTDFGTDFKKLYKTKMTILDRSGFSEHF